MKICIVVGTRPEIIKMSPILNYCEVNNLDYFLIHTGQHYSYSMDKIFFEELKLPKAKYCLEVGSGKHGEQTAKMINEIEKILINENPNIILVQGDTNSVLAGALAAVKLHIKIGHIEAGLRSFDLNMPEEINRKLTDHCSDFLFAPTEAAKQNLINEGIDNNKIFVTGNTIVDAVMYASDIISRDNLNADEYFLLTLHRQENVDSSEKLKKIIEGIDNIYKEFGVPFIFPIHPRTKKRFEEFNLAIPSYIKLFEPKGFLEFLSLELKAKLILTDSGGVQEEACILKTPCITLRENTERPETVQVGSNKIVGTDPVRILEGAKEMINVKRDWINPFGDGNTTKKIIESIKNENF